MSLFQIDAGREWRGGQRQSFLLAKELRKRGFLVDFVVQPGSPLHERIKEGDLRPLPVKMRSEFDAIAISRLALAMKRRKCQLVHFHDAHSVAVGTAAASLAKVPIRIISRRVDFPLKKNFLSRKKYTKDIDRIVAVSEGVKKVLIHGGVDPYRIAVVPDGIDFTPFQRAGSSGYLRKELSLGITDFLVGIVAHLADHKGHKYLIEASRILKERAPDIKVIIVGEGPLRMELTRQASDIQVDEMIFFLGFRDDVPQILASLDLFVLSSYLEGMGSSLMDAMASRLPIVATDVGGIPEVVTHGETGLLVPARDPQALADAILKLYGDRAYAKRLGDSGCDVVQEKFSAEAMASQVADLYEELAAEKKVRLERARL